MDDINMITENEFTANLRGYKITAVTSENFKNGQTRNLVRWDSDYPDHHDLPTCFGKIVGITTRPRPDHMMLIFFERAVYAMDLVGLPATFVFKPLLCE